MYLKRGKGPKTCWPPSTCCLLSGLITYNSNQLRKVTCVVHKITFNQASKEFRFVLTDRLSGSSSRILFLPCHTPFSFDQDWSVSRLDLSRSPPSYGRTYTHIFWGLRMHVSLSFFFLAEPWRKFSFLFTLRRHTLYTRKTESLVPSPKQIDRQQGAFHVLPTTWPNISQYFRVSNSFVWQT